MLKHMIFVLSSAFDKWNKAQFEQYRSVWKTNVKFICSYYALNTEDTLNLKNFTK
jgi:hypothetical protein